MKIKKILAGVLATTTILTAGLAVGCGGGKSEEAKHNDFIEELGGVSETYVGAVSESAYATQEEAALVAVQTELGGASATQVEVVSTTPVAEAKATEIKALLPAEEAAGVLGIDEVEVSYTSGAATLMAASSNRTVKVYIIKYENYFKYYTPCPITGETVSKSYYDSVFAWEKYQNCTVETTMEMEMEVMGYSVEVASTQLIKFSEDAIYLEMESSSMGYEATIYGYFDLSDEESLWVKMDSDSYSLPWTEVDDLELVGFESLDELYPFVDDYLDYTYFTKTDYGFELSSANAKQYIMETLSTSFEKDMEMSPEDVAEMMSVFNSDTITMFAKYYVSEGVLSGLRMDMSMEYSEEVEGETVSLDMDIFSMTKITNYGTTVVARPF